MKEKLRLINNEYYERVEGPHCFLFFFISEIPSPQVFVNHFHNLKQTITTLINSKYIIHN